MLALFAAPVLAQEAIPGEFLVGFDAALIEKELPNLSAELPFLTTNLSAEAIAKGLKDKWIDEMGAIKLVPLEIANAFLVYTESGKLDLPARLRNYISYIEPNYIYHKTLAPDDPEYLDELLWGLDNVGQTIEGVAGTTDVDINAPEAWDETTGDSSLVVGVIDTGIDYNHPDLAANIWTNPVEILNGADDDGNGFVDDISGYDFLNNDDDPDDDDAHGTHVAGTIGAVGNNNLGITGVNWDVQLMALKALGPAGGTTSSIVQAIEYARDMKVQFGVPVHVLNMSLSGPPSLALRNAIDAAVADGIVVIAAASNDGTNNDFIARTPGNFASVISVAAVDNNGDLADFSNFGRRTVDLAGPGVDILSTVPPFWSPPLDYDYFNGTSMATPHVAGVAMLMFAVEPSLTPQQVRAILMQTVKPLASLANTTISGGLVNAEAALAAVDTATVLDGTVLDEHGDPLQGVVVKAGLLGEAVTDENGHYEFNFVPDGDYTIRLQQPGFVFHPVQASIMVDGANESQDFSAVWVPIAASSGIDCSTPADVIPDADAVGLSDTLTLPAGTAIADLDVFLDITHSFVGDLSATLRHEETGAEVLILDRPLQPIFNFGCSGNNIDALFDDQAQTWVEEVCSGAQPTIAGVVIPNDPLDVFQGEDLAGDWTLNVRDIESSDLGTLNTWCLQRAPIGVDLELAVTESADPVAANASFSYTLSVTNVGTEGATGVVLSAEVPNGSAFVSAQASQGTATESLGLVTAQLGALAPGETATVVVELLVDAVSPVFPILDVTAPAALAGEYPARSAGFGAPLGAAGVNGNLVLVDDDEDEDGSASSNDGCQPLVNAAALSGNIAVIERGGCGFVAKVRNAQDAGAVAAVLANSEGGADGLFTLGGDAADIVIPVLLISNADGAVLIAALAQTISARVLADVPQGDWLLTSFAKVVAAEEEIVAKNEMRIGTHVTLDSDGDGVADPLDLCPGFDDTADADADGTPDACDGCPADELKLAPGVCGCGAADTDSDADGVFDCNDQCASDPSKTTPGVCGCGAVDTDTDGDGSADCIDACPFDASKLAVGVCGCGTADLDTDGDGSADCNDQCVNDAAKTVPGSCGCGAVDLDANSNGVADCLELGTTDVNGLCVPGGPDCVHEALSPTACVGVNGFLDQINILSVVNLLLRPLGVVVQYFDLQGVLRGEVATSIGSNLKQDFIVNDLGLEADTFGTACVITDADVDGAWTGGNTIYKEDKRPKPAGHVFGDGFDFAIYEPFAIPHVGKRTLPLNTFHLGTDPESTVANWISIIDAVRGDGRGVSGSLLYFDQAGAFTGEQAVFVPDGARRDFAGHEGLAGPSNVDAVGMVEFRPLDATAQYYLNVIRYFYDCPGASCTDFLTAFNIPNRPGTSSATTGGVSTASGEISIVELINTANTASDVNVDVFGTDGVSAGNAAVLVPPRGSRSVIVNQSSSSGFLADGTAGSAEVTVGSGFVSAYSLFYKLDDSGKLLYAYAAPFVASPALAQLSQFNSFISHDNIPEIYNSSNAAMNVTLDILNLDGSNLLNETFVLLPKATRRFDDVQLPSDTYGTVSVTGDTVGLVLRNYISRESQYRLPLGGE